MERDFSARTESSEKFAKQMESLKRWPCFQFPRCNVLNGKCASILLKVSLIQGLFSVYGTAYHQKEFTSSEFRLISVQTALTAAHVKGNKNVTNLKYQ